MVDKFSKAKRSKIMSKIRYKWTSPERRAHNFLKGHRVRHTMHPKAAPGADILIHGTNAAILLHGCFWHACPKCYRAPKSNRAFWKRKIMANLRRDKAVRSTLRKLGFRVIVIWEHNLRKDFNRSMGKIMG
ncbi:MAG: very short patch repair endonuclease [Candidatus Diapherotrites archaeon]